MFRRANDRVQRSERQTKRTREALAKLPGQDVTTSYDAYGNLVVESRYQALKLQLDEDERTLEDARERLHDLDRAAAREAIPLEWRR
jgi:YD repeat-containing protein